MKTLIISAVAASALAFSIGSASANSRSHDDNFDVYLQSQGGMAASRIDPSVSQAYSNEGGYVVRRHAPIRSFLFGTEPGWRHHGYSRGYDSPYSGYNTSSGRGNNNRDALDFDANQ
jgi:hypothetical protein